MLVVIYLKLWTKSHKYLYLYKNFGGKNMKAKAEALRKNHTNPVKRFFINIWQWFKETAWIQVLLIVGLIIGIVMSITPLVGWISGLVEKSKESTFYKDNVRNQINITFHHLLLLSI